MNLYILALELLNEREVNCGVDLLRLEGLGKDEGKTLVGASDALSPVKRAYLVERFKTIRFVIVNEPEFVGLWVLWIFQSVPTRVADCH